MNNFKSKLSMIREGKSAKILMESDNQKRLELDLGVLQGAVERGDKKYLKKFLKTGSLDAQIKEWINE